MSFILPPSVEDPPDLYAPGQVEVAYVLLWSLMTLGVIKHRWDTFLLGWVVMATILWPPWGDLLYSAKVGALTAVANFKSMRRFRRIQT